LTEDVISIDDATIAPDLRFKVLLGPFMTFLDRAGQATRRKKTAPRELWLEAAAELFPLEMENLDAMVRDLTAQGDAAAALRLAELITDVYPENARAFFRLAHVHQTLGDARNALAPLHRALALDPDLPFVRNNLAAALMTLFAPPEEIIPLLEAAVAAAPEEPEAWINLATQKLRVFDLEGALAAGRKALQLSPDSPLACNNYAQALKEDRRFDEAEAMVTRAIALSGGTPVFKLNLGLLNLLQGKYREGWEGYEWRWSATPEKQRARPVLPGPPWRGEPLAGKTLLLWGEEGNGDVMQFARFVPRMAELVHSQGGVIAWNSFPQFGDLLRRAPGHLVDTYVTGGIPDLPPFDYEFPLLSTPRLLGIDETSIPAPIPYLVPDHVRRSAWRERLAGETRLKVGLVWTGSSEQARNPFRSVDMARYAAAFGGIDHVAFYSLQVGASDEVRAVRASGFEIADHTDEFKTYDDTAAMVDNLDLVITICTSMAHLAGALGKPTWVILDVNPHWPWRLEGRESVWYPTARLYRQPKFADWDPVLAEVARDLAALAARPARGSRKLKEA
jgi:tetratricopeptide (TPR) repeat protein